MQNKLLFLVLIAVTITAIYAAPSSSCDNIDENADGFDRFWQKTKCNLSFAADKVVEVSKNAYNATDTGIQKTVNGTKDFFGRK